MDKNKKNVPNIRFPGFTEPWEQRKVSDVAEIVAGGTPKTGVEKYWNPKEVPWLSSGEVHKKYITFTDNMISYEGMNNSSAKIIKENSVLIALAGQGKTRGTVAINSIPLTTNQSIAAMTFKEDIFPKFIFFNLESRYDEIRKMSSGDGSRGGLNKQLIGDIVIPYTSTEEQKKIGEYFAKLDNLITLHQRKLDHLKEQKKGLLQKMFPKKGEKVPEIRFPGFTDDWEMRKVSDFLEERNEASVECDEYPLMAFIANKGVAPKGERYDRSALVNDSKNKKYKKTELGDFIYSSNNLETGSIGLNMYGNAVISPVYSIFKPKNNANFDFIGRLLINKRFIHEMVRFRQGVVYGQWKIHEDDFLKIKVHIPGVEEQEKIGAYFANLDNLITLHQRKLDHLKEQKKGLLQQMFV